MENLGLRIFLGSLISELEKLYGRPAISAIIYRIGQKPAEIVAQQILRKYDKKEGEHFDLPTAAFNLLENSITQLFEEEILEVTEDEEKTVIKIKNVCPLRRVIMSREDIEFGGVLCQFSQGYYESALKVLTGWDVEYRFIEKETTEDYCVIKIIFRKPTPRDEKKEDQTEVTAEPAGTEEQ